MNERIKELAVQAGATFVNDLIELSDGQLMMADKAEVDHTDMDLDKFVELIVWECCVVMLADPRLDDVRSATRGCARSIKEHFGVEE